MSDAARELLVAKLALEAELVRPLDVVGAAYITAVEANGGRPIPVFDRLSHLDRLEEVLRRHYARVAMVMMGKRPPRQPSLQEAALSLRHMESMIQRAKQQAALIIDGIDREMAREINAANAAVTPDDGTGHPVAGKGWNDVETKAEKEKVRGVTAGMIGRFRARLAAIANVNTNGPAEETRFEGALGEIGGDSIEQTWNSLLDGKERPAHGAAHGQTRAVDEPFEVWGEKLRFPGDTSLGASLRNTINCRCFLTSYAVASDGTRRLIHTGPSAPARRQRRRGDRVGENVPGTPTSLVTLNGRTRARIILGNGRLATLRQETPSTIVVKVGRDTIARATTSGGNVTSINVQPEWASTGIEDLIRRSVKHSAGKRW